MRYSSLLATVRLAQHPETCSDESCSNKVFRSFLLVPGCPTLHGGPPPVCVLDMARLSGGSAQALVHGSGDHGSEVPGIAGGSPFLEPTSCFMLSPLAEEGIFRQTTGILCWDASSAGMRAR